MRRARRGRSRTRRRPAGAVARAVTRGPRCSRRSSSTLALLTLYPFVANVWYSVRAMDLTQPFKTGFVGLRNFEIMVFSAGFVEVADPHGDLRRGGARARADHRLPRGAGAVAAAQGLAHLHHDPDPALRADPGRAGAGLAPSLQPLGRRHQRPAGEPRPAAARLDGVAGAGAAVADHRRHLAVDAVRHPDPARRPRRPPQGGVRGGGGRGRRLLAERLPRRPAAAPPADPGRSSSSAASTSSAPSTPSG